MSSRRSLNDHGYTCQATNFPLEDVRPFAVLRRTFSSSTATYQGVAVEISQTLCTSPRLASVELAEETRGAIVVATRYLQVQ